MKLNSAELAQWIWQEYVQLRPGAARDDEFKYLRNALDLLQGQSYNKGHYDGYRQAMIQIHGKVIERKGPAK
jgi:hypothetical protein